MGSDSLCKQVVIINDPLLVGKLLAQEKTMTKGPAYRHLTNVGVS